MKVTLSVIKADIGGFVGHSDSHPKCIATADKSFDNTRKAANDMADIMRLHGPFEPHRLPLEEMEYTTMPRVQNKLTGRFTPVED